MFLIFIMQPKSQGLEVKQIPKTIPNTSDLLNQGQKYEEKNWRRSLKDTQHWMSAGVTIEWLQREKGDQTKTLHLKWVLVCLSGRSSQKLHLFKRAAAEKVNFLFSPLLSSLLPHEREDQTSSNFPLSSDFHLSFYLYIQLFKSIYNFF